MDQQTLDDLVWRVRQEGAIQLSSKSDALELLHYARITYRFNFLVGFNVYGCHVMDDPKKSARQ
ncbi:hypothetical protein [Ferroacidibacillus organovorans]|uniref:Uncharacterized protein n=2 Tax=Ferroacidibacillus organovorans TaxID=1765683 RepID=A0A117SY14_9BACL|nr:hypothetical protein [Ferroacidibacillus organovorans]KUO96138.1 hypothetical protein ATW55_14490 [Ferroacidibacillus organovorans]OPG16972.1 hypothetical protein B2M26_03955 [Ferroacidibacillus organovorans]